MHGAFIILSLLSYFAFIEDFSSRSAAESAWYGTWQTLAVSNGQLQSHAPEAAESVLWRPSTASINAEWSFSARIYGGTSAHNMIRYYIADTDSLTGDCFFVQVGGANKNITLCKQRNGEISKSIESASRKQILSRDDIRVHVRVTRDDQGVFHLYSIVDELDENEVEEGTYFINYLQPHYIGLMLKNSMQRGWDLYMDDIAVSGEEQNRPIVEDLDTDNQEHITMHLSADYLSLSQTEPALQLFYATQDNTCRGTVCVYSADGRLIKTLCRNFPMDTEGIWSWNGIGDSGQLVPIGVYVLIAEITSDTVRPVRKRFTIAVIH